jgi:hypothetical protein
MGLLAGDGRPEYVVRASSQACTRCGAMIALDLLGQHDAWHQLLDQAQHGTG